jgi:predicted DNA-binding protein (MmcQ/YjbR family)
VTHKDFENFLLGFPDAWLDYPFGEGVAVYKIGKKEGAAAGSRHAGKMFAIIAEKSDPLRISLKCDPQLALVLREKYETVLPGYHLNKKHWNTIICSGQIGDEELRDFARHSHELVKGSALKA